MTTITEDYVSFEVAKLLKEKGFDTVVRHYYQKINDDITYHIGDFRNWNVFDMWYSMPTLQMAMKWLRKNYQIFIRPNISFLYPIKWYSEIFCYGDNLKTQQDIKTEYYDSLEQACEAALKYCLEYLI